VGPISKLFANKRSKLQKSDIALPFLYKIMILYP